MSLCLLWSEGRDNAQIQPDRLYAFTRRIYTAIALLKPLVSIMERWFKIAESSLSLSLLPPHSDYIWLFDDEFDVKHCKVCKALEYTPPPPPRVDSENNSMLVCGRAWWTDWGAIIASCRKRPFRRHRQRFLKNKTEKRGGFIHQWWNCRSQEWEILFQLASSWSHRQPRFWHDNTDVLLMSTVGHWAN